MKASRILSALAVGLAFFMAPIDTAFGGFLLGDGNAFLNGSTNFNAVLGGNVTNANVDYAVYTSAGFQTSFGFAASGDASKFVYAYQVLNNIGGGATAGVQFLSVGPIPGTENVTDNVGSVDVIANPNPLSTQFVSNFTSVKMDYTGTPLPIGSLSDFFYYTSSFGPGVRNATITPVGMLPIQSTVAAPVPEPAILAVSTGIVVGLVSRRRR